METSKKELKLFFYSIAHFEDKISIIDTVNIFIEYCWMFKLSEVLYLN